MAKVNEEQSATLLQSSLPDNSATSQAVQLILLTKKHTADIQIPDSGVFLDADLSVL
jgi:predicted metal-dependent HD superfamily phosphohydrolase